MEIGMLIYSYSADYQTRMKITGTGAWLPGIAEESALHEEDKSLFEGLNVGVMLKFTAIAPLFFLVVSHLFTMRPSRNVF